MFTQLFGHFLLNNNIITAEQLRAALEVKNNTHAKLGAMAIDAGYMTANQVDMVHEEQKRVDKRIGDIAVEMNFLTKDQVDDLLAQQKTANVVLGQALIDLGYLSNAQFEDALKQYKATASFTGDQSDDALAADLAKLLELEGRIRALEEAGASDTEEYPPYKPGVWYYKGDRVSENGVNYVCIAPDNVVCTWSPTEYPAYWEAI